MLDPKDDDRGRLPYVGFIGAGSWNLGFGAIFRELGRCDGAEPLKISQTTAIPVGAGLPAMRPVLAELLLGLIAGSSHAAGQLQALEAVPAAVAVSSCLQG